MDKAEYALWVNHLSVSYPTAQGWNQATREVSLAVPKGSFVGVAGESGSGKSTLVMAASRMLSPMIARIRGTVEIMGRDIFALSREELRQMRWQSFSFVPQSAMNALNPVLTIRQQMRDVMRAHHHPGPVAEQDRQAARMLNIVEISPAKLDAYPHQLSGGQRQRAVIALALLLEPGLVIMDEPTTALDVVAQRQVLGLIRGLQESLGFAVLFISHDLSLLLEVTDQVVVMYAGEVVESGGTEAMADHAYHPYSQALIGSFPPLHGTRRRQQGIRGFPPDMLHLPAGCVFEPRCPLAEEACKQIHPPLLPYEDRQVACVRLTAAAPPARPNGPEARR